jgi:ATP-dependent DNA ligase
VVACDDNGVPVFKMLRQKKPALLYAFDLLELNGEDLRAQPIEIRKRDCSSSSARTAQA